MQKANVLQIFEHEFCDFREVGVDIFRSRIARLSEISERLKNEFGSEVFVLEFRGAGKFAGIRARQFVGVVQIDDGLILEFLPKIYAPKESNSRNEKIKSSLENLFFMLEYSGRLATISKISTNYNLQKSSIFETLIFIFSSNLLAEIRKSANFEYQNFDKNRNYLRGKLLIGENIRQNSLNPAKFFTQKDEFTIDNSLNRVFKLVAKKLLAISRNRENRRILAQILVELADVSNENISANELGKIKFNRLNSRFEFNFLMAKMFISKKSLDGVGVNLNFVILWEMNRLFEDFIATAIRKKCREEKEIILQAGGLKLANINLRPDILVKNAGKNLKIIDTKYKIPFENDNLKMSIADIYQMFAYAKKFNVGEVVLLYPESSAGGSKEADFDMDENSKLLIRFVNLNRNIPREISKIEEELARLL